MDGSQSINSEISQRQPEATRSTDAFPTSIDEALGIEYAKFNQPDNVAALEVLQGERMSIESLVTTALKETPDGLSLNERIYNLSLLLAARSLKQRLISEEMFEAAGTDALTKLPNRLSFLEELKKRQEAYLNLEGKLNQKPKSEWTKEENAAFKKASFGIIYVDLDNFKNVNDTLGHDGGDDILTGVSDRLLPSVRQRQRAMPGGVKQEGDLLETDLLARIGGEELAVILSGVSTNEELAAVGNRLVSVISREPFPARKEGSPEKVSVLQTASMGGTLYTGGNPMEAISRADKALYQAKYGGKNRFVGESAESI